MTDNDYNLRTQARHYPAVQEAMQKQEVQVLLEYAV
jgi:hypothetical protein